MAKKTTVHFPFPDRKDNINIDEIIYPYGREISEVTKQYWQAKIFSKEVQMLQAQYFILEKELIDTFEYVYPCDKHLNVFSPRYAQIIKGACNLFEIITNQVYTGIFKCDRINIYNFLSLDLFMDFKNIEIECFSLKSGFSEDFNIFSPYAELDWDRNSSIIKEMIPEWWNAYNEIKHSSSNYEEFATMKNALRSMCALAILFFKAYGPGVTIGKVTGYTTVNGEKGCYPLETRLSELFFHNEGRIVYTY